MPTLRLALCQVNPTVGDLAGNAGLVRSWTRQAADAGAQLVLFPELMLTGYPVEDLVFRRSFVAASRAALHRLAADLAADGLGDLPVLVGYLDADGPPQVSSDAEPGRGARNAAAVLHRGEVVATYFKHHLPNYGVFDEDRYFVSGDTLTVVRVGGVDVALTICEDLWQAGGPFAVAREAGVGLVLSINGSPYELNKDDVRLPLVRRRAAEAGAAIAYVNMVGGQDELVYDGDSMVVAADGTLLTRAPQFVEHLLVHDLELPAATGAPGGTVAPADGMRVARHEIPAIPAAPSGPAADGGIIEPVADEAEVWHALVLGLRDYIDKNRFPSVVLGLSGGIDSAVAAAIAVDAVGPERVVGVSMPSQHSSEHSRTDAEDLAKRTGLDYRVEPIQPMVDTFLANMSLSGVAVENLQARVRGVILMALSNQEGHLVLTTGNKSELAVGYSTLYGDSVGGYNPVKDVWKTLVWRLAKWRNTDAVRRGQTPPIPENSIGKPPSAELSPGQLDSDTLPDYDVLDPILIGYVDGDLGRDGLVESGHDPAVVDKVLRMVDTAEYKRRQSAPGTKISMKAFGRDRRLPITNRWREDG
ncbi:MULTISPECIES: NAD+ synthase [Micromonospora]|uniref:Glutamine-dependent NAD(+) synthetase n=1 Tax=Micromonospora aurantiaca (nom. illeg.) TaxID=47850 RepID=A0A6N3KCT0_9ACTN|nr:MULTISPECIES: NAD+ synthase [Micromonospora]ADL48148.1 NAD+ synthetase [Micromonospora aurantiaca ATCC 27029]ADU09176.1 NAD+ synthetase [Micromonospora sp. L5]AXH94194.1 NAD+ synthase [Micromonospora aurantiaca]KAB1117564.1 NAD+ synthase [Micromonospora aurantiaca]MBC9001093.1 NAD+ synthase [Micromonospora aurantiaca]